MPKAILKRPPVSLTQQANANRRGKRIEGEDYT